MIGETSLLPAIRRLYDAATDAEKWPAFLQEVVRVFGGNGAHLLRIQPKEQALSFSVLYGFDDALLRVCGEDAGLPGALARLERHYAQLLPTASRVQFVERHPSRPFSCRLVMSDAELHGSHVYREILDSAGIEFTLGVSLPEDDGSRILMAIFRGKEGPAFTEHEVELFGELIPHIRQAVGLSERLARVDLVNRIAFEALDGVAVGLFLVDEDARLVHANAAARRVLDLADGMALRNGILTLHARDETTALRRAIWEAVSGGRTAQVLHGQAMTASRPSGNEPFPLIVGTLWANRPRYGLGRLDRPLAVVCVTIPEEPQEAPAELLRRLFGLTPAEARTCERLVRGGTVGEIADDLKIASDTVRSHLKNAFAKAGVSRQAELVAKILSTPVWMCHQAAGAAIAGPSE